MKTTLTSFILLSALCLAGSTAAGQTKAMVFDTNSSTTYRIPSIVRLNDGTLAAYADLRHTSGKDIGNGYDEDVRIDIVGKTSADDGATWGSLQKVLTGLSNATGDNEYKYAYGDAATVVDRESGAILMMNASGKHGFFSATKLQVARSVSTDGGKSWTTTNASSQLYQNDTYIGHLFFSSGRMIQSTCVKTGSYYRVYAAVNTRKPGKANSEGGSRVVYSDDFGASWHFLGGISVVPASNGDECKVEELPDGSILLSCRRRSGNSGTVGRDFNVFTFTDAATGAGSWGSVATSGTSNTDGETYAASCDAEVMLVPAVRKSDNSQVYLLLQLAAMSGSRENVGIYYKELPSNYTNPANYVSGWSKYQISSTTSAYSTMVLDKDGDIAFLYEENSACNGYDIAFVSLPLSTITGGAYAYSSSPSGSYRTTSEPVSDIIASKPVSTPVFSVNPGTYSVEQSVELSCATEGVTIHYTLDGSEPSEQSMVYGGAISITESATLKAIAIDADGNKSAVATAVYSIIAIDNTSKLGTTISLDYNSSHQLFSSGANGSDKDEQFFGFLRHDIAHVQMLSSSDPDLSTEGAGLYKQNTNNMRFDQIGDNRYLGIYNGYSEISHERTQYTYVAIVAPKGYRFTRYQMQFDTENSISGATIQQYTYDSDGNPVYDGHDLIKASDGSVDKTLDNGTNVLYFRVDVTSSTRSDDYRLLFKSLYLTYVIDQPFSGQVPDADGNLEVHTGLLDLGEFSYNNKGANYWSFDRDRVITDGQEVNIINSNGEKQAEVVTVDGNQYFVAVANGDYYVEAPKKFRVVGASLNFLREDVKGSVIVADDVTSVTSGNTYVITDGNGNYLNLSGSTIVNGTDLKTATKWTVTYHYPGYYITSGDYYIALENSNNSYSLTTNTSGNSATWIWNTTNHCFKVSTWNNNNNIGYNNGWGIISYGTTGVMKLQSLVETSGNTYTASDFTATVFNRENNGTATDGEKNLTSTASTATVTVSDYNNDAIHFRIAGLAAGSAALYNVNLTILPLNPEVQTLSVAAKVDGNIVGANSVTSLNYSFFDGNTVRVLVPKNARSPYSIVFGEAENEEKTLWYTTGLNNNSPSAGGYSNYYLVNSTANIGDYLDLSTTPYPGARVNADEAGTARLLATNIAEVVEGNASTLKDNEFAKANAEYAPVSLADGDSKTVYIYSADEPTFQIMPAGQGSKHIDYRYYTITVKPVVENEKPVVTLTPIYGKTLKGQNHKDGSIASDGSTVDDDHTFVGVTVTSEAENGEEAYGVLTNTEIIDAIREALKEKDYYGFTAADPFRGILYVDMSSLTTVTGETTDGVNNWDTFNDGTADNCLYFMPEGFIRNVNNTIQKKGSGFEAVGDIVVSDQQPFFTPHAFSTGTRLARYKREGTVSGQTGDAKDKVMKMSCVLPFSIDLTKKGTPKTSGDDVDNSVTFHDITGYGELTGISHGKEITYAMLASPVTDGVASANQPYYVTSTTPGFSFSVSGAQFAKSGDVSGSAVTMAPLSRTTQGDASKGVSWTATGTYSGMQPDKADDLWYFSKENFWKSGALSTFSNVNIRPFRASYTSSAVVAGAKATVVFDAADLGSATGINPVATMQDTTLVTVGDGQVIVTASRATTVTVTTLAGQTVATASLKTGETRILCLLQGVYIVNGKKVIVR